MIEAAEIRSGPLEAVPQEILRDLRRRYAEPQRVYHTWRHIEELLALFREVRGHLRNPPAVLWAILFHDGIYDSKRGDNEERSADLLRRLGAEGLDRESMAAALRLIEATKTHRLPSEPVADEIGDSTLFLDMDLAVLGAPSARFDEYEHQIRAEYAHLPEEAYRKGRSEVLRGFLERRPLFLSEWGRARFGVQALRNVQRALAALERT